MRKNTIVTGRAWAAWEELSRWDEDLCQLQAEDNELHKEHRKLPPRKGQQVRPPLGHIHHADAKDHSAIIANYAGEVIRSHRKALVLDASLPRVQALHFDAITAWQQVLQVRSRKETEERLRIAIRASGAVYPRCNYIFEKEKRYVRADV